MLWSDMPGSDAKKENFVFISIKPFLYLFIAINVIFVVCICYNICSGLYAEEFYLFT